MDSWLSTEITNLNFQEKCDMNLGSIYSWTAQDCHAWATEQLFQMGVYSEEEVHNFKGFCGAQLALFTANDFTARISRRYGHLFHQRIQDLLNSQGMGQQTVVPTVADDTQASWTQEYQLKTENLVEEDPYLSDFSWMTDSVAAPVRVGTPDGPPDAYEDLDNAENNNSESFLNLQPLELGEGATGISDLTSFLNSSSLTPPNPLPPSPSSSYSSPSPSSSYHLDPPSSSVTPPLDDDLGYYIPEDEKHWYAASPSQSYYYHHHHHPTTTTTATTASTPAAATGTTPRRTTRPPRRHARSPAAPIDAGAAGHDPLHPLTTPSRKRSRGPKSWEYVVRLLADPQYNPSMISWVDEELYQFKFNKPGEIARLWGQRSNKPNLSYDNFARGLRYHYKTGALKPVSERQLVYKFGKQAIDFYNEITGY